MSQATILQSLIMFFVIVLYVINTARKSSKQESRSMHSPKILREVRAKPAFLKTQEVTAGEKEDSSYVLRKKPRSRSKKILNRSLLKQSILRAEILRKKY